MQISSTPAQPAAYFPALLYAAASLAMVALLGDAYLFPRMSDDAYYYFVVAENLARHGHSEFTPGVPTNGYHPLWMLLLAAAGRLFGYGLATYKAVEIVAVAAGLAAFVYLFQIRSFLSALFCTFALWYVIRSFALDGMETSLLAPGLILLAGACLSRRAGVERHRPLLLFLACGLCLGTRLDSALLVLPILLFAAPVPLRARLAILAALAACGAAYALVNLWLFGMALPVSGTIKSLGGLQWNARYAAQITGGLDPRTLLTLTSTTALYLAPLAALALAEGCRRLLPAGAEKATLAFLYASVAGLALHTAKLLFLSSWQAWPWYSYPLLAFALPTVLLVERTLSPLSAYRALAGLAGLLLVGYFFYHNLKPRSAEFAEINRGFLAQHADRLGGAPVAMGDRAGSFAYAYPGKVYQLEGLVNDRAYLDALRAGGDIRALLCAKGVAFVLDYAPPLADYATYRIEVLRPFLTTFRGPYLDVRREDEAAYYEDLSRYDNRAYDEGDYRLYAWRLDCGQGATRPADPAGGAAQTGSLAGAGRP